ncbi:aminotransferase class I and II [Catenulispora acidiphila DSM 44928]|uniref:cysteine-S-conjugate beta-lyase n=1 Tax=Catenulispora acidiphila (strain DSM 44928 / JCM 14897 / NBRC 102108 / NRRL B-24433 / ID139908) TaxID=479433 RepID=C7QKB2_CATAD|nr:aminotransferase class I/II-fold pyridoxal phosphate-dependent enzyme [Catenulispora acidiphila]ACU75186.1 aminotransferase class I and II [Catenulispora acidiphila DSM 44928]
MSDASAVSADPDWLRSKPGLKWATAAPDVLPAWVAEMDFAVPPPVRQVLTDFAAIGDLGYPAWMEGSGTPLREAFRDRMTARYDWSPDPAHVREFTDLNQALQAVLHVATEPGDAVAMHVPGYPTFLRAVPKMGRRLIPVPLHRDEDGWSSDADCLDAAVTASGARTLILVNPNNPVGRVLTRSELSAIATVAEARDLLVISDEIHADLTYAPAVHIPFASLSADAQARTVTMTSASKAFNIAGACCAVAYVGSERVRDGLDRLPPDLLGRLGAVGVAATLAAWREGDPWLAAVLETLSANRDVLGAALPKDIGYVPPEATCLAWLDCRSLGLSDPADFFLRKAGVDLISGSSFGTFGEGFVRLNFGTTPAILTEICARMTEAVTSLGQRPCEP